MQNITPKELQSLMQKNSKIVVLDVREEWEYDTCAIEGSQNISMTQIAASLDSLNKEAEIIVLCHHGMRSQQAAAFLEQQGFEKIFNLEGGIHAWATEVEPSMPKY